MAVFLLTCVLAKIEIWDGEELTYCYRENVCVRNASCLSATPMRATKSPTNEPKSASPGALVEVLDGRLTQRLMRSSMSGETGFTSTAPAR